ncbi:integral membrane sensor signal transduction histidine kinase [Neobacillus bataviensis LMG 21833]|uniref:histidine kinase n=1 Tax=Neobacillus bataviensis LMG 21833 TaxID=1117379 RepID=K6DS60_9BACI|nr:HAMP domain-containing sensor histidine kinase [Neobacillus bataviensis]EKN71068.1 integral membrane sensor signal transduction histidine kinase [Neobacillus bataviensis LMG 21833]
MNIHKRFLIQFFIQLILLFILFFCILIFIWGIIGFAIMKDEVTQDLAKADNTFFSNRITIKENKTTFDTELTQLVSNQKGWLLVLTKKGEVIGSYHAPEQVPLHFSQSELAVLLLQDGSASVEYSHWLVNETEAKPYLLLFGRKNAETELLNEIKTGIDWNHQQLHLTGEILQKLKKENAWVQLIDSKGKVVDHVGVEKNTDANPYSLQKLHHLANKKSDSIDAYHDAQSKQTVIVGIQDSISPLNREISLVKTLSKGFVVIPILLLLLLLMATFWYARKFGVPLITMMKWIQNLGNGVFEQPYDLHQHLVMLNKKGKLKRKYRLYKEFIATLSQLTATLKENETQRLKMTQTREEWISGISHDLKTPLSSISGYAQMMESDHYSWTPEETREFAGIITQKSTYMMDLLEDLTLTYRLKNQALPLATEKVDMNEFIRRTIIQFINDPANNEFEFNFHPYNEAIFAMIDPKWFQRVIDNLLTNACKYNPSGTKVTISISSIEQHLMTISIEDDGIGMDKETLNNLFTRYYRGTNTSDSGSGTGLGMAITKQLVQLHGGSINVKSTPHMGTIVRILIPLKQM